MPTVTVKVKKPKPLKAGEMRKALTTGAQKAANAMAADMDRLTRYWSNPVKFVGKIKMKRDLIELTARPKSPRSKWVKIFGYVDEGTPPHIIRARKKPALAFASKSKAGSKPNSTTVSKSSRGKVDTLRKVVRHPGNKPRNWTKLRIAEWRRERKLSKYGLEAMKVAVNVSGHKHT